MKKLIILIIGIVTAVPAFCQLDTLKKGTLAWIPPGLKIVDEPPYDLIKLRLGKLMDIKVAGGMGVAYVPESDVDSLNKIGKTLRFFAHQIPNDAIFTATQRQQIEQLINSFIAPIPVAQIDTVDSEALTYTGWARHGATSAPGWYAGTISYSSTGEASYTFTGTRVQIFGETKLSDGTGTVTIGDKVVTAQYNKAQVLPAMVYDSGVMPRGTHTMTLKPQSGSINVDFLVITR